MLCHVSVRTGALHALDAFSVAGVSPGGRRAGRLGLAVARVEGETLFQYAAARARMLIDGITWVRLTFRLDVNVVRARADTHYTFETIVCKLIFYLPCTDCRGHRTRETACEKRSGRREYQGSRYATMP